MPAPEETTDDSASVAGSDRSEPQERAEAGAARSGRRNVVRLVVTVVLVVLAVAAVRGAGLGEGGSSSDSDSASDDGSGGDGARRSSTTAPAETTAGAEGSGGTGTTATAPSTTSSSVAPPDVARPRPVVDLASRPPATDPVEVARWWAATFVAYGAAEPAADLVARLDPYTTSTLRQALLGVPPAASYDLPLDVAGVSAQVDPATAAAPRRVVTAAVETPGALVVYRLALVQGTGGWQVDEANRV